VIRKHAGEIGVDAAGDDARSGEAGGTWSIGVGPCSAAISGFEEVVGIIMREAAPTFIHAGDIYIAVGKVTGDLHVPNEGTQVGHRDLAAPSGAVVSGAAYHQGACTYVKVVPGNVHVSEVRRGGVVVSPAGFPVIESVAVNAKMSSPASRVCRSSGLEPAQGAAPIAVEPDREPCAGWFVVQNNGVPKGVVKGASTGGSGDAGEGGPAIRGTRYAGEVAKV